MYPVSIPPESAWGKEKTCINKVQSTNIDFNFLKWYIYKILQIRQRKVLFPLHEEFSFLHPNEFQTIEKENREYYEEIQVF